MGGHLVGHFEPREESYEGFGRVPARVRYLEEDFLAARDALYELSPPRSSRAASGERSGPHLRRVPRRPDQEVLEQVSVVLSQRRLVPLIARRPASRHPIRTTRHR